MHVLILTTGVRGHHLAVAGALAAAVQEYSERVTLVLPTGAAAHPEFDTYVAPRLRPVDAVVHAGTHSGALADPRAALRQWGATARAIRRRQPDYVYLLTADRILFASWALPKFAGGAPIEVQLHGDLAPPEMTGVRRMLQRWIYLRGMRNTRFHRFLYSFPRALDNIRAVAPDLLSRCALAPPEPIDPVHLSRAEARAVLGFAPAGRWVGAAGETRTGKGIVEIAKAFAAANPAPDDRFFVAGRFDGARKEVRRQLEALGLNQHLLLLDRFLSCAELDAAIAALDVVAATYVDHIDDSMMVVRAAAAERFVLASNRGWLGYSVPENELGLVCDVGNPAALRDAVRVAMARGPSHIPSEAARAFAAWYSTPSFNARWTDGLRAYCAGRGDG